MEKIFIEPKYSGTVDLPKELLKQLPTKVMLAMPVQFIGCVPEVKSRLEAYGKQVYLFKSMHGRYPGQVLGCDNFRIAQEVDCFLYIGDGEFHPRALLANEKPVFAFNPLASEWKQLGKQEWEKLKLRKKVGLMKFYNARTVGVLITLKPGQKNMQGTLERVKRAVGDKKTYYFLGNELSGLENFNFIDCWVNTACPRMADDVDNLVNLRDIEDYPSIR